jgi:hypothetical protein
VWIPYRMQKSPPKSPEHPQYETHVQTTTESIDWNQDQLVEVNNLVWLCVWYQKFHKAKLCEEEESGYVQ